MKFALCFAFLGLGVIGCSENRSQSYPVTDEASPVQVQINPGARRFAELVGDGAIDISSVGDFSFRHLDGRLVENNPRTHDEEFPGTAHISMREGEQMVRVAPMLTDRLNLRLRHWTGAALTADDCRDIGSFISARSVDVNPGRYAIAYHHVEADGKGCAFTLRGNNSD